MGECPWCFWAFVVIDNVPDGAYCGGAGSVGGRGLVRALRVRVAIYVHELATAVPPTSHRQSDLRDLMVRAFEGDRRSQVLIRRIYGTSGIERRHTVVRAPGDDADDGSFFQAAVTSDPSTAERNERYIAGSRELLTRVGRDLLDRTEGIAPGDVTHVVTVTCTGFFAPDPAFVLVRELGLSPSARRYNIGFMGCFAAFQALQMAQAFCQADPDAVVLLVCVEICSIHLHLDARPDDIISASVFADGAAGGIVSARRPGHRPHLRIDDFHTALSPEGESDMAWTIGDHGFEITLSRYVPEILHSNLRDALAPVLEKTGDPARVHHFAVHPGGRAILDKVESALSLAPPQLASSRRVLARFGNMSSATVLFVLRDVLDTPAAGSEEAVVAMAFGPGLTVESGLFTKIADARVPA